MVKISSFNCLWAAYSHNCSSFRDQLLVAKAQIDTEQPDVAVFLEMCNPYGAAESATLSMLQHIQAFELYLFQKGYVHQRKTNDLLSVWVVSRLQLIPLLLLGADKIGTAAAKVLKVHLDEFVNRRIEDNSDYVDCAGTVISPTERSIIVGVVCNAEEIEEEKTVPSAPTTAAAAVVVPAGSNNDATTGAAAAAASATTTIKVKRKIRRVLPLIATHARCLYNNTRFAALLFSLLRSFVARKGIVIGDMNVDVTKETLLTVQKNDPRVAAELQPGALDALWALPMCPVAQNPGRATCTGISFPFQPLNIDGIFAPNKPVEIKVRSLDDEECDEGSTVGPNELFPSDHRWIVADIPRDAFLEVPVRRSAVKMGPFHQQLFTDINTGEDTFVDARVATHLWSQSMPELMKLCETPVVLQRPSTIAAVAEALAQGLPPPVGGGGAGFAGAGAGGSRGPIQCFTCGGAHFARDCPKNGGGGGGGAGTAAGAQGPRFSPVGAAGGGWAPRPPRSVSPGGAPASHPAGVGGFTPAQLAALAPPSSTSTSAAVAGAPAVGLRSRSRSNDRVAGGSSQKDFSSPVLSPTLLKATPSAAAAPAASSSSDDSDQKPTTAAAAATATADDLCCFFDMIGECRGNCGRVHRACRFGEQCTRRTCMYGHPSSRVVPAAKPATAPATAASDSRGAALSSPSQMPAHREATAEGERK